MSARFARGLPALGALVALVWGAATQSAQATPPGVRSAIIGPTGNAGWYRGAVTLRWEVGTDGLVSSSGCEAALQLTEDTSGVTRRCEATYTGGVTMSGEALIKIDKTPPSAVRAVPATPTGANGWFTRPVTVAWTGTDALSGLADCTSTTYAGPDAVGVPLSGTCRDAAGNVSAAAPFALNFDATAPTVTGAAAARSPDHGGWYLHPVAFAFRGQDGASGIDSCDVVRYAGPDGGRATVGGACRDRAGNSASGTVPLRFDGKPPALTGVRAIPGRRAIRLHWRVSPDARHVVVTRSPGLRGALSSVIYRGTGQSHVDLSVVRDVRYVYRVTAVDPHAKTATRQAETTFSLLLAPLRNASLQAPPVLRWRPVPGARYYNVQLYRGRRLVHTAWPSRTALRLGNLPAGRYRWYVWPGYRSRAERAYGRLLGQSSFTLVDG